ncbi:YidC/Oxa1 family membrane protein insertase, partial [bacterium]|nr:YidC/Oxa1 family membrane protein insertase [bacterium]
MDFVTLTIELLKILANILHSWGFAIIALTIIIRVIMWPSSVSQQRSMRQMQTLQPKMKAIQERYKSNPEMMQRKMMEFYKEHQFNPMSGCLPMLIQLPIFILLYTALMSPQFTEIAGKTDFLFIKRLDATIKSNAGVSFDGKISATPKTKFMTGKTAIVTFIGDEEKEVKIDKPQ